MASTYEPPRLRALIESRRGISAITVPRADWDALNVNSTRLVQVSIAATPLGGVEEQASVIAAVAAQTSTGGGRVSIYRNDPRGVPTPINVDHYTVLTILSSHPDLPGFVRAASTALNPNLTQWMAEHVFLIKERPGPDHWLREIPAEVSAVMRPGWSG